MTVCEMLRLVGTSVLSSEQKDTALLTLWETLQRIRPGGFSEECLEQARDTVYRRLTGKDYVIKSRLEAQCRAYLRTAVRNAALDCPPPPPPPPEPPPPPPPPPDFDVFRSIHDDVVALWGADEFRQTRKKLVSQIRLRETSLAMIDLATGARSARDVLSIGRSAPPDELRRRWGAFKKVCQRAIKALLLTVPRVCVARQWAPPDFGSVEYRVLEDLSVPEGASPELVEVIRALVAIATSYQRGLVGTPPPVEG